MSHIFLIPTNVGLNSVKRSIRYSDKLLFAKHKIYYGKKAIK